MHKLPLGEAVGFIPGTTHDIFQVANKSRSGDAFSVARMANNGRDLGLMGSDVRTEMITASVHLCNAMRQDWSCDGRHCVTPERHAGSVNVFDLRYAWHGDLKGSFDLVKFHVPLSLINDMIDGEEAGCLDGFKAVESPPSDPVLYHLAQSVLPALANPTQTDRLLADHICHAAALHVATTYGGLRFYRLRGRHQGGLAPWQERRVKEFMAANLHDDITLQDLADLSGFSVRHFRRAFKASTGTSPHQWLIGHRIAKAQDLMANTDLRLAEIALAAGFASQSHFTRVFAAQMKATPAMWRRLRRM